MKSNGKIEAQQPQHLTLNGRRMVLLDEAEYERLRHDADAWEPAMPAPDDKGNYPALEAMAVSLARGILRERRRLGWSQTELARRAGIRQSTLDQIERAQTRATARTIERIDSAIKSARTR